MNARGWFSLAAAALWLTGANAQSYSNCNPLTSGSCPPDPALGKSVAIDFTKGVSDLFNSQGNPTFDSNGASFTIVKQGDSPQITSKFYIMFGRMEVSLKAAPGAGIVSSVVMQSDDLDEIDWEWLGADPERVQTNYFGKGQTGTYNRGAFHPAPGSQSAFNTYTIDWTADQVVWQINNDPPVRKLRPQDSAGQYPQTPMQIKIGCWSAGDPSNAPGTIQWAEGPTDFSKAPFTMQVKSLTVTDYSTGTQYQYKGQDGTWQSIVAVGGQVNPSGSDAAASSVEVADAPAVTSASPGMPMPFEGTHKDPDATHSTPGVGGWAIGPSTMDSTAATATSYPGLPSGWTVSSSGKVVPPSAAPSTAPLPSSSASSPEPPSAGSGIGGGEVTTGFDERGFPTVYTVIPGASTMPRSYNEQGFLITAAPADPQSTGMSKNAAMADQSRESGSPTVLSATAKGVAAALGERAVAGGVLAGLLAGMLLI